MKINIFNTEIKSRDAYLVLGGAGMGILLASVISKSTALARGIFKRQEAITQTEATERQEVITQTEATERQEVITQTEATERQEAITQTDQLISIPFHWESTNTDYLLIVSGENLVPQEFKISVPIEAPGIETQTEDERTFYCTLDSNNQTYPPLVDRKHCIKIGQNEYATYNLVLAMLTQENPQDPFTRIQLSEDQINELSNHCGIPPDAFEIIWSGCRNRVLEGIFDNPGTRPQNYSDRNNDRFRALWLMLINYSDYNTSDETILKKRKEFLSLLESQEIWLRKFRRRTS